MCYNVHVRARNVGDNESQFGGGNTFYDTI